MVDIAGGRRALSRRSTVSRAAVPRIPADATWMTPEGTELFTTYTDYAIDLAVDVAAIFFLAYVLYFRRHRRADLLLGYVSLNIGIFVAMSLLGKVRVDIALGFGLFAILSIIRLRSTSVTQQEVAYYFIALVMGLVNGLDIDDRRLVVVVNGLLIVTMAIVDSKPLRERARRMDVHLDVVHSDDAALVADLERRLGGRVVRHEVNDIDYVRQTMVVDVRYRVGMAPAEPQPEERRLGVKLDVIHTDDAALVADLERRLGGRVVRHEVKDIDYVRDTMEVDVRYLAGTRVARPALAPANHARPDQAASNQAAPNQLRPVAPAAQPQLIGSSADERTVVVKR
jgi:hypothetical protein